MHNHLLRQGGARYCDGVAGDENILWQAPKREEEKETKDENH